MIDLQRTLEKLSTEQLEYIDSVLMDANLAYSIGNKSRVTAIFKAAKNQSKGQVKKIFAAFQKAEYTAIKTALDHHFEYRRI